ncbi:hypothetical protein GQ55_1G251800 [Panicum hallii var. hallii]|uniref:Uncharacterized protein n=1 Tax=Panicum hallii var. hallii TaxID=1504633 RepID=A0A2T7F799_9POAL|nr:hypothetical protein GQ55_1G251800 [Panicum hallii var. hallii]
MNQRSTASFPFLPSEILNPVCERACIATRRPLIAAAPLVNFATATTPADPHHQRFRRDAPHVSPSLPSRLPLLLRTNHVIFDVIAATNIKLQLENNFTVTTLLQKEKRKKNKPSTLTEGCQCHSFRHRLGGEGTGGAGKRRSEPSTAGPNRQPEARRNPDATSTKPDATRH